jgi:hypothetical protein
MSPVNSISIACLGATARRQRHHRRRAEQANIDPGRGEVRVVGGDRQVCCRDQLAAGRGCDALDLRDHRPREVRDRLHQAAAQAEHLVVEFDRRIGPQLLEVVAGTERRAGATEDDHAHLVIVGHRFQLRHQLPHQLER